jgi:large subunit ribosomal protein L24
MIQKGDRVILLKDITYTESFNEDEDKTHSSLKGDTARVLLVDKKKKKLIVEGVNIRKKAIRPSQDNPRGGWISKEMPVDVSNVMLFSPELGHGVRTKVIVEEGKKKRVDKKTGSEVPFPNA